MHVCGPSLAVPRSLRACHLCPTPPWQLYEFHAYTHGNTTNPLHDPKMFLGFRDGPADTDTDAAAEDTLLGEHRRYHVTGGAAEGAVPRVALMGQLAPADAATPALRGTLVLFNARTAAEAERYMAADPVAQVCPPGRRSVSVVNEQDVDGLHHLMARTFGEKTVLDQVCTVPATRGGVSGMGMSLTTRVFSSRCCGGCFFPCNQVHFMDPEDLLEMAVPELPGLEVGLDNIMLSSSWCRFSPSPLADRARRATARPTETRCVCWTTPTWSTATRGWGSTSATGPPKWSRYVAGRAFFSFCRLLVTVTVGAHCHCHRQHCRRRRSSTRPWSSPKRCV